MHPARFWRQIEWALGVVYGGTERLLVGRTLRRRYGLALDAHRVVHLGEMGLGSDQRRDYLPSPWDVLRRVLRKDEVTNRDVFLDIGCGMGTVLLEAGAHYPFRRVMGIDIAPQFTGVARDILARNLHKLRCEEFEVVTADATQVQIPDDVTVIFMGNPVLGASFEAVLTSIIESVDRAPRRLRLVYLAPEEAWRIERSGRATKIRHGRRGIRRWTLSPELVMYSIKSQPSSAPSETQEANN